MVRLKYVLNQIQFNYIIKETLKKCLGMFILMVSFQIISEIFPCR